MPIFGKIDSSQEKQMISETLRDMETYDSVHLKEMEFH